MNDPEGANTAIVIRAAAPADMDAITAIYADSVRNGSATYEIDPPSASEMIDRFHRITADGYPWLVAERDGTVLGFAYASAYRTRPAYRYLVEDSIYLDPGARRQGIGLRLLERLLIECEQLGFRQMVAVIGGAEAGSIAVHQRAGFEHRGSLLGSGYKFDRWLDTVFMQKPLGEGAGPEPGPVLAGPERDQT